MDDAELRASHEDRDRVAELLRVAAGDADDVAVRSSSGSVKVRVPPGPVVPVVLRIVLSGTVGSGHIRARPRRRLLRHRAAQP